MSKYDNMLVLIEERVAQVAFLLEANLSKSSQPQPMMQTQTDDIGDGLGTSGSSNSEILRLQNELRKLKEESQAM
jgi:hypothetical protein